MRSIHRPRMLLVTLAVWLSMSGTAGEALDAPPPGAIASGTIFILGEGVKCKEITLEAAVAPHAGGPLPPQRLAEICNTTWIRIEVDGIFVSVKARKGATAAAVAANLATAIASHTRLSERVSAKLSDETIHITARQPGLEHAYGWSASCSHIKEYFDQCGFQPMLSPVAILAP